jgi:Flp pilus assembly protein TadG
MTTDFPDLNHTVSRAQARLRSAGRWVGQRLPVLRGARSEDGQAVVELALALPILLVVLLGIYDFGRAINYWNEATNLANVGARYAAVGTINTSAPCASSASVVTYIQCEAQLETPALGQTNPVKVCVDTPQGDSVGNPVTVTVSTNYNFIRTPSVLGGSVQIAPVTLTGSATMRIEQPAQNLNLAASC